MNAHIIPLYAVITKSLQRTVGYKSTSLHVMYTNRDGEEYEFDINSAIKSDPIVINDFDPRWSPEDNNLILSMAFSFNKPSGLFGYSGVTASTNKLAVGYTIASKTSGFQETCKIDSIPNQDSECIIEFEKNFHKGLLRGSFSIEFFIYLEEISIHLDGQAGIVGTHMTTDPLLTYQFIVDGNGSMFPIVEIDRPGDPLWNLDIQWSDPMVDTLDESSVILKLNSAHPRFNGIVDSRTYSDRYIMKEILIQVMTMIIQQALQIEGYDITDFEDAENGTIAKMIWYWVKSFNIRTSKSEFDAVSISNSIRMNEDKF